MGILATDRAPASPKFSRRELAPAVAPALGRYARDTLAKTLSKRLGLSLRDRSLVTVAASIAHGQTADLPAYVKFQVRITGGERRETSRRSVRGAPVAGGNHTVYFRFETGVRGGQCR
jgi:alkylhydroperoxidase/carboxymuconolactone decarboxylase family protein YurZ